MTRAGSHPEEPKASSGALKPPRHPDTERDQNGRPKPESHVESVTSISPLPAAIPKKPVDSKPHTVEGEPFRWSGRRGSAMKKGPKRANEATMSREINNLT